MRRCEATSGCVRRVGLAIQRSPRLASPRELAQERRHRQVRALATSQRGHRQDLLVSRGSAGGGITLRSSTRRARGLRSIEWVDRIAFWDADPGSRGRAG
jgi:hypothetical protein